MPGAECVAGMSERRISPQVSARTRIAHGKIQGARENIRVKPAEVVTDEDQVHGASSRDHAGMHGHHRRRRIGGISRAVTEAAWRA